MNLFFAAATVWSAFSPTGYAAAIEEQKHVPELRTEMPGSGMGEVL
ncbi:hypothetical protein [Bacillus vallismortis]|nr:hypothetical protein [Bacillus sp. MSP13]